MNDEFKIGEYYDTYIYDYEKIRLQKDSVVEYEITLRMLKKWIADNSIVADIGAGFGHYALALAKRGCRIHLADVAKGMLKAAKERVIKEAGDKHLLSASHMSATNLYELQNESLDALLLLGPLYHLTSKESRQKAVHEAFRVLKPGGVLFASSINRFQLYKNLANPKKFLKQRNVRITPFLSHIKQYFKDGILIKDLFGPLGNAHLSTPQEFESLFTHHFFKQELIGLESFFANQQELFVDKDDDEKKLWLDVVLATGKTEEGIHNAEHLLFVGKKIKG